MCKPTYICAKFLMELTFNDNKCIHTHVWFKQYLLDQPNTCTTGVQYYSAHMFMSSVVFVHRALH